MNLELSLDSIETAHHFVVLLSAAVVESRQDIAADVKRTEDGSSPRLRDALQLTLNKLEKLDSLLARSRRTLNDLRSLRRLMFEERGRASVIPIETLPDLKVSAGFEASKRRALSARVEAKPKAGALQIMPWYLRPDSRPGTAFKRAA